MSSDSSSGDSGIKIPNHSMPSDYSDVHPKSYDPEFISQISSQMQVPDRIAMSSERGDHPMPPSSGPTDRDRAYQYNGMTVPDRILVAVDEKMNHHRQSPTIRLKSPDFHLGKHDYSDSSYDDCSTSISCDNQHIGVKSDLALHLRPDEPAASEAMSYVGLLTPPRTLTMEESFPVVEDEREEEVKRGADRDNQIVVSKTANGHVYPPSPYDPGVNPHDSLLLNEEDEVTLLRTQMSKLARRVQVIEEEHKKRSQREIVLYPFIFGYVLWKVLGWLARDSR